MSMISRPTAFRVRLEVANSKANVRGVVLQRDTVIGRSTDCNLRIASRQVSRQHCRIRLKEHEVFVCDLGSSNGTFVDGKQIAANHDVPLTPGSRLSIGGVKFIVQFEQAADPAKPAANGHAKAHESNPAALAPAVSENGAPPPREPAAQTPNGSPPPWMLDDDDDFDSAETALVDEEEETAPIPVLEPTAEELPAADAVVDGPNLGLDDDDLEPLLLDEDDSELLDEDDPADVELAVDASEVTEEAEDEPLIPAVAEPAPAGMSDDDVADFLAEDPQDGPGSDNDLGDFLSGLEKE